MVRRLLPLLLALLAFPAEAQLPPSGGIVVNQTPVQGGTTTQCLYITTTHKVGSQACSTGSVSTFSAGTTGFTPSSATSGAVTLAGVLIGANGGSGVANTGTTFTRAGNVAFAGAFAATLTVTGTTGVTLPTSGTLVNDAVTTLSSLVSVGTITTGAWNAGAVTSSAGVTAGASSFVGFAGRSRFSSAANGNMLVSNGGITDFTCFQLGGVVNTFPAVCRSSTTVAIRLADNSADAPISATTATWSNVVSDAAATTNTLCRDTASGLMKLGSGTLGICLGTSSARFKHDVLEEKRGVERLSGLRAVSYKYNGGDERPLFGFIAEEVAQAMPELVSVGADGRPNSVDMLGMIPFMVNAIKEMKAEIDTLRAAGR